MEILVLSNSDHGGKGGSQVPKGLVLRGDCFNVFTNELEEPEKRAKWQKLLNVQNYLS